MFGIGTTELMVILVVAIIVIGPSKLPQIARGVGKAFGEFKRASNDLKRTIDHEVDRIERDEKTKKAKAELLPEDAPAAKPAPAPAPDKDPA
jgi:sec-independent protein translocase protein TatB